MGLAEKLRQRAALRGRTAGVECGELGVLTVEALPLREIELLYRGGDGARALFYAACRELQAAGEELRKTGEVYTPDGILQFVSQAEAEAAARVVLDLSGYVPEAQPEAEAEEPADTAAPEPVRAIPLPADGEEALPAAEQTLSADTAAASEAPPLAPAGTPAEAAGEDTLLPAAQRSPIPEHEAAADGKGAAMSPSAEALQAAKTVPPPAAPLGEGGGPSHRADPLLPDRRFSPEEAGAEPLPSRREFARQLTEEADSPSVEALARALLEGLRRASWVRGG